MESTDIFSVLEIEHYSLKSAFCVQCYGVLSFQTAYYTVNAVDLYNILNRPDNLLLKVADLVMCLALHQTTARIGLLKFV